MSVKDEAIESVCDKVRKIRADLELEMLKVRCLTVCLSIAIIGLFILAFVAR